MNDAKAEEQLAQDMDSFFAPLTRRFEGMAKSLAQSLEAVRVCANYQHAQQASLRGYLKQF